MTVAEYVPLVWLKFKGKGADKAPSQGSPKWNNVIALTNFKLREKWATDPKRNWNTLASEVEIPAGDTITLPTDTAKVVGDITLVNGDQELTIQYVDFKDRKKHLHSAYVSGEPKTLSFTDGIPTDYVGGTARIPVNTKPSLITSNTDTIVCDNIAWLVAEVAAELAFKKAHYADLVNEAQYEYEKICDANSPSFSDSSLVIENGYGDMF